MAALTILDDRGRLFGRVNVIDAFVGLVVLVLVPVVFGAYLLFRKPVAHVTSIDPPSVLSGAAQVAVHGDHLRPYLRVTVGGRDATFLFQDGSTGLIQLPADLPPGKHDVLLFDEAQQIGSLPAGLTVEAPLLPLSAAAASPHAPVVIVVGAFRGLDQATAQQLTQALGATGGDRGPWGEAVAVKAPVLNVQYVEPAAVATDQRYYVEAVLRLACEGNDTLCHVGGSVVKPKTTVPITIAGRQRDFGIEEVHPAYDASIDMTLRTTLSESLCTGLPRHDGPPAGVDRVRPMIVSATSLEQTPGARACAVVLRVPVVKTAQGWIYQGRLLRANDNFTVDYGDYSLTGSIMGIDGRAAR